MSASTVTRSIGSTAAIAASISAAPRITPAVAVPTDSTTAIHAGATLAAERLADCLAGVTAAGNASIVALYGADIDLAAIRLAKRAADDLAGGTKARGEARQDVIAVIDILTRDNAPVTDRILVAAARVRLDANKAAKKARRDMKQGQADILNDKTKSMEQRSNALGTLAAMDDADAAARSIKLTASLKRALAACVADGMSEFSAHAIVAELFTK